MPNIHWVGCEEMINGSIEWPFVAFGNRSHWWLSKEIERFIGLNWLKCARRTPLIDKLQFTDLNWFETGAVAIFSASISSFSSLFFFHLLIGEHSVSLSVPHAGYVCVIYGRESNQRYRPTYKCTKKRIWRQQQWIRRRREREKKLHGGTNNKNKPIAICIQTFTHIFVLSIYMRCSVVFFLFIPAAQSNAPQSSLNRARISRFFLLLLLPLLLHSNPWECTFFFGVIFKWFA